MKDTTIPRQATEANFIPREVHERNLRRQFFHDLYNMTLNDPNVNSKEVLRRYIKAYGVEPEGLLREEE